VTEIILHLGAHKTATTHIQSVLGRSSDILQKHDIGYIPLNLVRKNFTNPLSGPSTDPQAAANWLSDYLDCAKLIISDENLIGATGPIGNRGFYPVIRTKIAALVGALSGYSVNVHITIRDYCGFIQSRYIEYLRHKPFLEFDAFCRPDLLLELRWKPVVDAIAETGWPIYITEFNSLIRDDKSYLMRLIGETNVSLASACNRPQTRRSRISAEAHNLLRMLSLCYSPSDTPGLLRYIDNLGQPNLCSPLSLIPEEIGIRMNELYHQELSTFGLIY
jgi:hypothetical protein